MEIGRLKEEADNISSYEFSDDIFFTFHGILSLLDTKALNAFVGNRCQKRCPICFKLPRELKEDPMAVFDIVPGVVPLLCLSILHFLLRAFDHLLKLGYHKKYVIFILFQILAVFS